MSEKFFDSNNLAAWEKAAAPSPGIAASLRAKWLARIGLPWTPAMTAELSRLAARLIDHPLPTGAFAGAFVQGEQQ